MESNFKTQPLSLVNHFQLFHLIVALNKFCIAVLVSLPVLCYGHQFQQENVQLLERLHDVSDEVRQIQHKVVHIAELQRVFTEKVMEQVRTLTECGCTWCGCTWCGR